MSFLDSGGGGGGGQLGTNQMDIPDAGNEFNRVSFIVKRLMARMRTLTPVKVTKVLKQDGKTEAVQGEVSDKGAGFVEVQPLISMVDGNNQKQDHGVIYNIPYHRVHGGGSQNAMVIDPVKGDIGLIFIGDRDKSKWKTKTVDQNGQDSGSSSGQASGGGQAGQGSGETSLPGSQRRFDLSDSIYVGAVLTKKPKQYMTFTKTGTQWAGGTGSGFNTITMDNSKTGSKKDPYLGDAEKGKTDTGVAGFLAQTFHGHQHGMGEITQGGQQIIKGILSKLGGSSGQGLSMKFDASIVGAIMSHIADAGHTMKVNNGDFTHTITNGTHTETAKQIVHNGATNVNNGDLTCQQNVRAGQNGIFGQIVQGLTGLFQNGSFAGSDLRMKTNSEPLRDVLDAVMSIPIMRYNYHPSKLEKGEVVFTGVPIPSLGVHAQELRRLFPELVRGDENDELLSINEAKLGILAIAALQQAVPKLQDQINSLQETVDSLNAQVSSLRAAKSDDKPV